MASSSSSRRSGGGSTVGGEGPSNNAAAPPSSSSATLASASGVPSPSSLDFFSPEFDPHAMLRAPPDQVKLPVPQATSLDNWADAELLLPFGVQPGVAQRISVFKGSTKEARARVVRNKEISLRMCVRTCVCMCVRAYVCVYVRMCVHCPLQQLGDMSACVRG
eukprot:GHVU01173754.1.p2 GENE.GHVU01173754.1~~GHVU01173754.1.p2  ORF type:complete len:163 (-),score=15.42 GHVU01173754.1:611-1099(-)